MANTALLRLETVEGSGLRFSAVAGSGQRTTLDSGPGMIAPSPVEALLIALASCEGMDVISILRKKRQRVTSYEIAVRAERRAEYPRAFTRIEVTHTFRGHELSAAAIADAIHLSETKYCSVHASLSPAIEMVSRSQILAEAEGSGGAPTIAPVAPSIHSGLSELILRVADVERAVAFYTGVVGLALEEHGSPTWAWLWTGAPGALPRLGLTSRPLSFGAAHTGGPAHFAIAVPRVAIPAEKARLEALGIEVEGPITFEWWHADSIYFSDPDRNRVELCGFEHLNSGAPASTSAPPLASQE
jgi:putative redox protein